MIQVLKDRLGYSKEDSCAFWVILLFTCLSFIFRKRKVREIEDKRQQGGNSKWKIKGQSSRMRAKERRVKARRN